MYKQPRLLTIREASIVIGVQYRQLLNSVSDGTIPYYKLDKSRRLVDPDEVMETMREQGGQDDE